MKRFIARIFIILCCFLKIVANMDAQSFQKSYKPESANPLLSQGMAQRPDGNFLMAFTASEQDYRVFISCLDAQGTPLWSTRINIPETGTWSAYTLHKSLAATSDNGCVALLAFDKASNLEDVQRYYIAKLDAAGQIEWVKLYDIQQTCFYPENVVIGTESGVYVGIRDCDFEKFHLVHLSNSGEIVWEKDFDQAATCAAIGKAADQNGALLTLHTDQVTLINSHIVRVSGNATVENLLTLRGLTIGKAIQHPDGRLFFTAASVNSSGFAQNILLGMAQGGQLVWVKKIENLITPASFSCSELCFRTNNERLILAFFNGGIHLVEFTLDGVKQQELTYLTEKKCASFFISSADNGMAWLSPDKPVLWKTDPALELPACTPKLSCAVSVSDASLLALGTKNWTLSDAAGFSPSTLLQEYQNLIGTPGYCPPDIGVPDAAFSAQDTVGCIKDIFKFESSATVDDFYSRWYLEQGNPIFIDNSQAAQAFYNRSGYFSVRHSVSNACNIDTALLEINVQDLPRFQLSPDTSLCNGDTIFIGVSGLQNGSSFFWENQDTSRTRAVFQEGNYIAKAINSAQCAFTDTLHISAKPANPIQIEGPNKACIGDSIRLSVLTTAQNPLIIWQKRDTLPEIYIKESGWYTASIEGDLCKNNDSIFVEFTPCVDCNLYLPNAISPGSSQNSGFGLNTNCTIEQYALSVYDRWGNQVFYSSDPRDKWDGNFRGKTLLPGVYLYHLEVSLFDGRQAISFQKKGDVAITR